MNAAKKPSSDPAIVVLRDGNKHPLKIEEEWSKDRTYLVLRAKKNEIAFPEPGDLPNLSLRWKCSNADDGKLELWLRVENRR